ncbi:hypothetical protein K469DRAFT_557044 [Zopfia rhizophila CBS 207.26]|uniref:Dihydrofolate reductase n=1 Tax=Zopfia rhizophila CBS 207.26 TaxID=1314779 RepID=A0A6A6EHE2_9PEZI|nr:hypothetical protein K469DRAFT_557044 [Zopfia rhizophila CBS 207.26]
MPPKPPLTLVFAATPTLGIGSAGQLPWPQLKQEMGYFARVTKRVLPSPIANSRKKLNAVIMGRKTWESIPLKFRPLKGRLNVVITRDVHNEKWATLKNETEEGPIIAPSITAAVEALSEEELKKRDVECSRVFVIGGASIYKAALEMENTDRVLLTKIGKEYRCDTFFPVDFDGEEGRKKGWARKSREELEEFVGEEVKEGGLEEQGVPFEFCLYEREVK